MAQLKDLLVTGASSFIGPVSTEDIQLTKVYAPTSAGGTTYSIGSANYVLASDGTTGIYWKDSTANTINNVGVGWSQQESPSDSLILTVQVNSTSASAEIPKASSTTSGIISIGTQEIKGVKTFIDSVSATTFNGYLNGTASGVKQLNSTENNDYRVLLSTNANDNDDAGSLNKNTNLRFNPTNQLFSIGGSITATGDLTITGNTNLNGETYIRSLTAGSLLVNGNANFVQTPTAPTPANTSNDTSVATTAFVMNALTINDALIFKGTIAAGENLPAADCGHLYKVSSTGTINEIDVWTGDTLICTTDNTAASTPANWIYLQTGDGTVIGPASSTTDHIATFTGTTGKVIKDSGYTIAKSVPSTAVFTDTTYTFADGTNGSFTVTPSGGSTQTVSIGKPAIAEAAYTAGAADTASKLTDINSSDAADSTDTQRYVWFSYDDNTTGRPAYSSNFTYQTSTGSLIVPQIKGYVTIGQVPTTAIGLYATAEGTATCASATASHAEGYMIDGPSGYYTRTSWTRRYNSSSTSYNGSTSAQYTFNGISPQASGIGAHTEGINTKASGYGAHAEGASILTTITTTSTTYVSGSSGYTLTTSNFSYSFYGPIASATASHAEGANTTASGVASHAEGHYTQASGTASHAEGFNTKAFGDYTHAEGYYTMASMATAHAEGYYTTASRTASHAEGYYTTASGTASHAEGYYTTASGTASHAEGCHTKASGSYSHAEGYYTTASGSYSHVEGSWTVASGSYSHVEGYYTTASGSYSHSQGYYTIANHASQFAFGEYNIADDSVAAASARGNYIEIVGNGTSTNARSNARTLDWDGNETISGNFLPMTSDNQNIGSTTATWKNIYLAGGQNCGLFFVNNNADLIGQLRDGDNIGLFSTTDLYLRPRLTSSQLGTNFDATIHGAVITNTAVRVDSGAVTIQTSNKATKSASIVFNETTNALDFVFA